MNLENTMLSEVRQTQNDCIFVFFLLCKGPGIGKVIEIASGIEVARY